MKHGGADAQRVLTPMAPRSEQIQGFDPPHPPQEASDAGGRRGLSPAFVACCVTPGTEAKLAKPVLPRVAHLTLGAAGGHCEPETVDEEDSVPLE